jgi:hypothetical protein
MSTIDITEQAMAAIRANVTPGHGFHQTATRLANGMWRVPVNDDTLERIQEHQLPGESVSETIYRILATRNGKH